MFGDDVTDEDALKILEQTRKDTGVELYAASRNNYFGINSATQMSG